MINNQGNERTWYSNVFSKILITLFFIFVFATFLYLPKFIDLFFSPAKEINVFAFTDMILPEVAKEFEEKTGIHVRLRYSDTNNELLAKLRISKGEDYDLITATDFVIDLLRKDGLLQKIDHSQIPNFKDLDKRFINHYFDPENKYSTPFFWSVYGIVFNKDKIKNMYSEIDWGLVFSKPKSDFQICMLDDTRDSILLAAIYLFGKTRNLTSEELKQIKNLLVEQKKWVEIYTSGSLQYYLLTNISPVAVTSSAFAKKILEMSNDFDFILPQKGSILNIESFAIPSSCKKNKLVYKFINFLLSKDVQLMNSDAYGYNPINKKSYSGIEEKFLKNRSFFPDNKVFSRLHFVDNELDGKAIEDLLLAVKLS